MRQHIERKTEEEKKKEKKRPRDCDWESVWSKSGGTWFLQCPPPHIHILSHTAEARRVRFTNTCMMRINNDGYSDSDNDDDDNENGL